MTKEEGMVRTISEVFDEVYQVSPEQWDVERIDILFSRPGSDEPYLFQTVRDADTDVMGTELRGLIVGEGLVPQAVRMFKPDGRCQTQIFSWTKISTEEEWDILNTNWVLFPSERVTVD